MNLSNLSPEQLEKLSGILEMGIGGEAGQEEINTAMPEPPGEVEIEDNRTFTLIPLTSIKVPSGRQRKVMGNIEELAESIKIFGLRTPIQVLQKGEIYELIAGERRVRACTLLGFKDIPALIENETAALAEAHEAIENIHRKQLEWHEEVEALEKLHNILAALNPKHTAEKTAEALNVARGKVSQDLNLAQALRENPELTKCKTKKQAVNELVKSKLDEAMAELTLRRGKTDYGKKAAANLFFGDSTQLIKKIPDASIDLILTDPPYGIEITDMKRDNIYGEIYPDSKEAYMELMTNIIPEFHRVLKQNSWCVIFFGIQFYDFLKELLEKEGFIVAPIPGIWWRGSGQCMQPNVYFASTYETYLYARLGDAILYKQGQDAITKFPGVPTVDKEHPVEKPVELMVELLERFSMIGSKVLDTFAGSAVTLEACIKLGRTPIGFEKDEKYFRQGLARLGRAIQLKEGGFGDGIKST